jgi:hypothetical protein
MYICSAEETKFVDVVDMPSFELLSQYVLFSGIAQLSSN